jgi:membrane fusion protein (multidrug efflux system)
MTKRMIIMLAVVALVFGAIFGFKFWQGYMMGQQMAKRGAPVQTVSTMQAAFDQWQPSLQAVGSISAMRGADLSSELPGTVTGIHFKQGDDIRAGTPLFDIDASSDIARLHALQAVAELAKVTYDRDREQLKVQAVSQQTVDADRAQLKQARANVDEQQAVVDKKRIRAPFDGRVGVRAVDLGQYVRAGDVLVTLQALDPIYVDFLVPQQVLARLHIDQTVTVTTDAWPERSFEGTIEVIDPKVDTATRNIKVRARLANPDKALLPGMYAHVEVVTGKPERHVTLPQTAVTYHPFGTIVYRVETAGSDGKGEPKRVAKQVFVTTGDRRGDQVAILKGLNEGDTVVTSGQIKLHNGSVIKVNNAIQPANDPNPTPSED